MFDIFCSHAGNQFSKGTKVQGAFGAEKWSTGGALPFDPSFKGKGPRTQVLPLAAPSFRPLGETYRRFALKEGVLGDSTAGATLLDAT